MTSGRVQTYTYSLLARQAFYGDVASQLGYLEHDSLARPALTEQ